ncbi:MFS transporter [Synergistaceae bacterium OttesenSCG-928-I11]|nr:MFS transporter [Synergistaceae bacterium OttesenSCG-928-I11]
MAHKAYEAHKEHKRTMFGLSLSVFVMMLGVGTIMPLLPGKVIAFGGSESAVAYIASAFALPYILLQVPMGAWSDRLGVKRFLIAGYLLCGASGLIYYFADSAPSVLLGRVVQGAGEAPLWALAPALLSILYAGSKGRAMGVYNATLHVGLTLGPLLGIVLLRVGWGAFNFLFFSACCAVSAVVVALLVENRRSAGAQDVRFDLGGMKKIASDRAILVAFLGIMLYGAGYGLFLTTLPAYMVRARGYSQTFVQFFFASYYLAVSLSQIVSGPLTDRYGPEKFMVAGLGATAVLLALLPLLISQAAALTAVLGASLGLGTFFLSSMSFLNAAVPAQLKGTISGTYYLFWGIGFFTGPIVVSRVMAAYGDNVGLTGFAALMFAESVALFCILRRKAA